MSFRNGVRAAFGGDRDQRGTAASDTLLGEGASRETGREEGSRRVVRFLSCWWREQWSPGKPGQWGHECVQARGQASGDVSKASGKMN